MTKMPALNRANFDWEDAKRRLARLAHTLDAAGSMLPEEASATLEKRARELAVPLGDELAERDTIEALAFRIGSDVYALETTYILELTHLSTLTVVPGCPPFLRGVTNLRGEILAVIDLSLFFGLTPTGDSDRLLVLGLERPEFGILIDEADEVKELSRSSIVLPAVAIPEVQREFLLGATPDATLVLAGMAMLGDARFMIDEV